MRFMITHCWRIESVLFHAQYITSPAGKRGQGER